MRLVTLMATLLAVSVAAAGPAADVSGEWVVTITAADATITGRATLKQAGDDVTGFIGPAEDATIAVEGTWKGDTLTLTLEPRPGRTAAFETCTLTIEDGSMTGTMQGGDVGKGLITFVRRRP